jgi:hypothetical protein
MMRVKAVFLFYVLAALALTISAPAQEGHPLTGVWYGDWGTTAAQRNDLTVVMQWNGKAVTGSMNPGPDAVEISVATLDSSKWTVHIESNCMDKGAVAKFVADGRIEDLGSAKRTLTGTVICGTTKGDFKLRRD